MVTPVNKAAVLYGNFDLRIEDRPMPVPGPREVLVEVASVGVCGSDVHYYEHGRIGDFVVRAPLVLGHETSGIVVGRGGSARRHELGQRVALEPGVPCGSCRECRTGHYNLCRDVVFFATPPVDGTLARYVTIHEDYAFALPDHVSDDAGALCEPLSVGLWACRKAGITVGARVAVAGGGPIGAAVTLVALAAGATEVIVSDPVPERRARLLALGATSVVDATSSGLAKEAEDADVFVDCSGGAGGDSRRHPVRAPRGRRRARRDVSLFRGGDPYLQRADPGDHSYRYVSLRQHLSGGDRPRGFGGDRSRRPDRRAFLARVERGSAHSGAP